ncbi:MAG: ABC transporter permease [Pirellulaceae bacterium]|nr:ABC transporter permease [Pirellulaceae bacterium]
MSVAPTAPPTASATAEKSAAAGGFWGDAWRRFRRKTVPMIALGYVVCLAVIALLAPVIVGTKPVVCRYQGRIYFPCLSYVHPWLENPVFRRDKFRNPFYKSLQEKDPQSWAIYPLIYQDPERRVGKEEVDGLRPAKTQLPRSEPPATSGNSQQPSDPPTNPGFDPFGQIPGSTPPDAADPFGQGTVIGDPFSGGAVSEARQELDIDDGPPNSYHWMGVTNASRIDVLAVIVHGTKIAMLIGFVTVGISAVIGITLGAIAGYVGGWVDILISRLTELIMSIPVLILIIALLAVIDKPSIWQIMLVLGLTGWTSICRLTRAEFLKLRTLDYVSAAKSLGASTPRVLFRHILPNAMAPVLVPITFGIAGAILTESGLSLLGLGSPPDTPSWGALLNRGRENFETMWWLILFPGLAIFSTVLAYNLIGEGLQEVTDPRLREAAK